MALARIIGGVIDVYRQMIDALTASRRVLVTTHVRPDGDALGTVAAMVLGMRKVGIAAEVLLLSHLPRKYAFIFRGQRHRPSRCRAGLAGGR